MTETIQILGLNWPKLIAQTVNFAIVLFVLWRWAYRPVLSMLAERQQRIAESMENAEKIKTDLTRTEVQRQQILDDANTQGQKLIDEARAAAARVQEQETQKAILQAEQIIAKAREAADVDRARMLAELKQEIGRLVVQTTGNVTGKILTPEDQQRLVEETNRQLAA